MFSRKRTYTYYIYIYIIFTYLFVYLFIYYTHTPVATTIWFISHDYYDASSWLKAKGDEIREKKQGFEGRTIASSPALLKKSLGVTCKMNSTHLIPAPSSTVATCSLSALSCALWKPLRKVSTWRCKESTCGDRGLLQWCHAAWGSTCLFPSSGKKMWQKLRNAEICWNRGGKIQVSHLNSTTNWAERP